MYGILWVFVPILIFILGITIDVYYQLYG